MGIKSIQSSDFRGYLFGPLADGSFNVFDPSSGEVKLNIFLDADHDQRLQVNSKPPGSSNYSKQFPDHRQFLGRGAEIAQIFYSLSRGRNIQLCGPEGIGKDFLVWHFITQYHSQLVVNFPHGILYPHLFEELSIEDILVYLFNYFFEPHRSYKPSLDIIKKLLAPQKALFIIDLRVRKLKSHEFQLLVDCLPNSQFLFISHQINDCINAQTISLSGLCQEDCIRIINQYLSCDLGPTEKSTAEDFCRLLQENPRDIIQSLTPVRTRSTSFLQAYQRVRVAHYDRNYTLRNFVEDKDRVHEKILAILSIFESFGLTEEQLASILGIPDLKVELSKLLQKAYIKITNPSLLDRESQNCHARKYRYQLSSNIAKTLKDHDFYTFNLIPSINYFLKFNCQDNTPSFNNLLEQLGPCLLLFKQAQKQNLNYSVLALGKAISDIASSLGFWELRKQILSDTAKLTFLDTNKTRLFSIIGLQEICMANFENSLRYFELASQTRPVKGSSNSPDLLNYYKQLASQGAKKLDRYTKFINSHCEDNRYQSAPRNSNLGTTYSPPSKERKCLGSKASRSFFYTSLRWAGAVIGTIGLIYLWLVFMQQQIQGNSQVPLKQDKTIQTGKFNGSPNSLKHIGPDITSTFYTLNERTSLLSDESFSKAESQEITSRLPVITESRVTTNQPAEITQERLSQSFRRNTTMSSSKQTSALPRVEQSNSPLPSEQDATAVRNLEIAPQDLTSEENNNSTDSSLSDNSTNTLNHVMISNNVPLVNSIIYETQGEQPQNLADVNRSEDNLSESMCSFLISELNLAKLNSNQNPAIYRRLIEDGNCQTEK